MNLIRRTVLLTSLLLLMQVAAVLASASTITIASTTVNPTTSYPGSSCALRIYSNITFTASDGSVVMAGTPGSGAFYKAVSCTIVSGLISIPAFTLPSTTDALDNKNARYTAIFYDSKGVKRDTFLADFPLPLSLGSNQTWAQIRIYKSGVQPWRDTSTYTKTQTDAQIALAVGSLNVAGFGVAGRIETASVPSDALHPKAVLDDDPRLCSAVNGCFRVIDYGAVPYRTTNPSAACASGTDSAAAITAADAAATAWAQANNGNAVVMWKGGVYCAKRSPQTTNSAYAQIPLGKLAMGTNKAYVTWDMEGGSVGNGIPFQTPGTGAGYMIYSTLTGQTYSGTNGTPCIIGGPDPIHGTSHVESSWMARKFIGLALRTLSNPTLCGMNLSLFNQAFVKDFRADVDGVAGLPADFAQPTHAWATAVLMPLNGRDGMDYEGSNLVAGWYGGFGISELTEQTGVLYTYQCKVSLVVQAPYYHSSHLNHVITVHSPYGIAAIDPAAGVIPISGLTGTWHTHLSIDLWTIEDYAASWSGTVAHIYDPESRLSGRINYFRAIGNVGNDSGPLTVVGARNVQRTDLGRPFFSRMIVYDSLDGVPLTSITARRPQQNQNAGWVTPTGFAAFQTISVRNAAQGSSGADNINWIETNHRDVVCSVNARPLIAFAPIGLVARAQDESNFFKLEWVTNTGVATFYRVQGGVYNTVGSVTVAATHLTTYTLETIASGNNVTFKVNGITVATDTTGTFNAQSKHGIWSFGQNSWFTDWMCTNAQ